jgi:HK97 gp10 family phage protein
MSRRCLRTANIRSTVTITGGEEILRRLEHFGQRAINIAENAVKAGAKIVCEDIRQNEDTPRLTGDMADSFTVGEVKKTGKKLTVKIGLGKGQSYKAKFMEFGTSNMRARPFMTQALKRNRASVRKEVARILKEGLGF